MYDKLPFTMDYYSPVMEYHLIYKKQCEKFHLINIYDTKIKQFITLMSDPLLNNVNIILEKVIIDINKLKTGRTNI